MTNIALHQPMISVANQVVDKDGHISRQGAQRIVDVMINESGSTIPHTIQHIKKNYKITDEGLAVLNVSSLTKFSILPKEPYRNLNALARNQLAIGNIGDTVYTFHQGKENHNVYLNVFPFMVDDAPVDKPIPGLQTIDGLSAQLVANQFLLMMRGNDAKDKNLYGYYVDVDTLKTTAIPPPKNSTEWIVDSAVNSAILGNTIYITWLNTSGEVCLGYYNIDREEYTFISQGFGITDSTKYASYSPSIEVVTIMEKNTAGKDVLIDKVLVMWCIYGSYDIQTILFDPTQGASGAFEVPRKFGPSSKKASLGGTLTLRVLPNSNTILFAAPNHAAGREDNWLMGMFNFAGYHSGTGTFPIGPITFPLPFLPSPIHFCSLGHCEYVFYMDSEHNGQLKYEQL